MLRLLWVALAIWITLLAVGASLYAPAPGERDTATVDWRRGLMVVAFVGGFWAYGFGSRRASACRAVSGKDCRYPMTEARESSDPNKIMVKTATKINNHKPKRMRPSGTKAAKINVAPTAPISKIVPTTQIALELAPQCDGFAASCFIPSVVVPLR